MQFALRQGRIRAATVALALVLGGPVAAAEQTGVQTIAEDLGSRAKTTQADQETSQRRLSDDQVRMMLTTAIAILPEQVQGPGGQIVKIDKSDPSKYLIPFDDARRVIRVATRSAYAEVCNLQDLARANIKALLSSERAHGWTPEQMLIIQALHTFSAAFFAGNDATNTVVVTIENEDKAPLKSGVPSANDVTGVANNTDKVTIKPNKPKCTAEKREEVTKAITAYVQSAPPPVAAVPQAAEPSIEPPMPQGVQAPAPAAAAAPQAVPAPAPVAGGAN